MSLAPGTILGHYRIARMIGSGGMGAVYDAVQLGIERHVAIKILHAKLLIRPDAVRRFLSEARAVNLVDHPSVVPISEASELEDGTVYLVMDFLRGESMMSRIRRLGGMLPAHEVVRFARQVAAALAAAHAKGIVHRDLKPDNLMLVPDPEIVGKLRVRILDFGIAKLLEQDAEPASKALTVENSVIGTPRYMAPEQCRGSTDIDEKADVYSLGVILYEALAGRPPFVGQTTTEVMAMHMYQPPPPLADAGVTAPAVLLDLIMRMLNKDRGARPSMAIIAASLTEPEIDPAVSMSRLGQAKPAQPEPYYLSDHLPHAEGVPVDPDEDAGTMSMIGSSDAIAAKTETPQTPAVTSSSVTAARVTAGLASTDSVRAVRSAPAIHSAAPAKPFGVLVTGLLTLVLVLAGSLFWSLTHPPVVDSNAAPSQLSVPSSTSGSASRTDATPQATPAPKSSGSGQEPASEQNLPDQAPKPTTKASSKTSKQKRSKSL